DLARLRELLFDDLVAEIDALVADVDAGPRDELLDLLLALSAERALQQVAAVTELRHACLPEPTTAARRESVRAFRGGYRGKPSAGDDLVDDAVGLGLGAAHDEVAVGVLADPLDRLAGVEGEHLVEELAHAHD